LNSHWFNIFSTISRARTWVTTSQTYETFQPSMYVNGIKVDRQGLFLVILLHHALFLFLFEVVNVMLQPLHYNLSTSKTFSKMHAMKSSICFEFEFLILVEF
jgi:hypothetical protein